MFKIHMYNYFWENILKAICDYIAPSNHSGAGRILETYANPGLHPRFA